MKCVSLDMITSIFLLQCRIHKENDMDGLKTYFNDNIVPMKDNLQMNSIKINGTDNLKVRAIKGLVTTKILQAQEKIYLLVLKCQS